MIDIGVTDHKWFVEMSGKNRFPHLLHVFDRLVLLAPADLPKAIVKLKDGLPSYLSGDEKEKLCEEIRFALVQVFDVWLSSALPEISDAELCGCGDPNCRGVRVPDRDHDGREECGFPKCRK